MGRLGKLPVSLPQGVTAEVSGHTVVVKGPKATLAREFSPLVKIEHSDEGVAVAIKGNAKTAKAAQGSVRSHINNMVKGVSEGWKKQLEINGPGYRAEIRGRELVLSLGYSHPVNIAAPEGINFSQEKNIVTVEGADKELVGHISALIRDSRRPNPYTGSGVKYVGEIVRRKVGKQAGKAE